MEQVDLVNDDDTVVGVQPLRMDPPAGLRRRSAKALIFTDATRTRIFINRRSMRMHHAPGKWDVPGGMVDSGETYADCIAREIAEELFHGVQVPQLGFHELFKFRCDGDGNRSITTAFETFYDGPCALDPEEATEYRYVSIEELRADILNHPEKYTDILREMLELAGMR